MQPKPSKEGPATETSLGVVSILITVKRLKILELSGIVTVIAN
jgi:hypothetical protein